MTHSKMIPQNNTRIKQVSSFDELVSTPFGEGVNALCWPRTLRGDFGEIMRGLDCDKGITVIDDERLLELKLSDAGRIARDVLLADQHLLRARNLEPSLNHIDGCTRDKDGAPFPRDVLSFHVDSATVESDTYLCTYFGATSEGLPNEDAQRRVDIPETRAKLLALYGGADDDGFIVFLNENFYDLHYAPLPHARPYSFGLGNLWRVATEHPGCPVPPCIHRAPTTAPGDSPRLLLIS